jgi:hypothetical protein
VSSDLVDCLLRNYADDMGRSWTVRVTVTAIWVVLLTTFVAAATKVHVITFGKWMAVQCFAGTADEPLAIKVRALVVDGRVREYVVGATHDVTERLFVVRRAFRVNDGLPEDAGPRWQWQRGGWLVVDRLTGRVAPINLPEFDAYYSAASWYRDYVAYCGVADDGKKTFAVVVQLGRRKAVLKKVLGGTISDEAMADSLCPSPIWQRSPVRVNFEPAGGEKQTFAIRGTVVDMVTDSEEE